MLITLLFLTGCSNKGPTKEYNKPDIYWYEAMIKSIAHGEMEEADDYYLSLSSEHITSPFLEEAMLILAQAHMDEEEYLLANFYLDEYIKRFGDRNNAEFASFLKIKANFLSFKQPNRDQKLLLDTIAHSNKYIERYPHSDYLPEIKTMLTKMYLGSHYLNVIAADLYDKMDKPGAAEFYRKKLQTSWLRDVEMIKPEVPWYRAMFE
jgi:outer membrane protein assembly factor BamD